MGYTIDIDTGGTFTDGFFTYGNRSAAVKVDTTPHDLTVGFMDCIRTAATKFGLPEAGELLRETDVVRFSTTMGTNALLQRTGIAVGLIVTAGCEENLYGRSTRSPLFDFILRREMVIGIREESGPAGSVIVPVDEAEVRRAVRTLLDNGARMIAVSLKASAINPVNEVQIGELIRGDYPRHYLGSVPVLLASELSIRSDPALRTSTLLVNAYLHPGLARSLYTADETLRRNNYAKPLLIVHSTGGVARVAKTTAIQTYNSGPVAGLHASLAMGRLYDQQNIVTLDVGGTSADIGLIHDGAFERVYPSSVEGIPVDSPMMKLTPLAAGGGSLARIDASQRIIVGPQSAGAIPGPACYALGGTEATLTDAYLALGYIDAAYFMGGQKRLNRDLALQAIDVTIASPLKLTTERAAFEIKEVVVKKIADQIDSLIGETALDPEEYVLFAFGGGGGCLGCDVARRVGISRVYVFAHSPVFCAFGSSTMDVLHIYEAACNLLLRSRSGDEFPTDLGDYNRIVADLQQRAFRDMRGEGFRPHQIGFTAELEIRAGDPTQPIIVQHPNLFLRGRDDVQRLCDTLRQEVVGGGEVLLEIVRLKAACPTPHYHPESFPPSIEGVEKASKGRRDVYWGRRREQTSVYERKLLTAGNIVKGPAIIEAEDATYTIAAGYTYTVDRYLNGFITEG